jgi:hypothetical protein
MDRAQNMTPSAMAPEQAWTVGLPLRQALNKYSRLKGTLLDDADVDHFEQLKESKNYRPEDLKRTFKMLGDVATGYLDASGRRWDEFAAKLATGRLVATGFILPRRITDKPTWIPLDVWHSPKVNWDQSSLKGGGLEFESVRVARTHHQRHKKPEARIIHIGDFLPSRRQAGRPSMVGEILRVYEHLKNAGEIDFSQSMIAAADKIRAAIQKTFPDRVQYGKGLKYEAIRRIISTDFHKQRIK